MTKTWELISMPQGRNVGSDLFISTSWDSLRSRLPDPASSPVRLVNAGSQGPQILPRRWRIGRGADLQNRLPIHIGPLRPSAFPETSGIALPLLSNRRVSDRYGRYKRPPVLWAGICPFRPELSHFPLQGRVTFGGCSDRWPLRPNGHHQSTSGPRDGSA